MDAISKIKSDLMILHNVEFDNQNVAKLKTTIGLSNGFDFRPELRITKLSGGFQAAIWVGNNQVGIARYYKEDGTLSGF